MDEIKEERKTTYPPSWVVMQNNIQECFKSMNIDEKRMLILASPIARTTNAKEQDKIIITAEDFARESGIKTHSAYKQLEVASKNLIKRNFSYSNERGKRVLSNWVIDCTYEQGGIAIRFPEIVLYMLKEFDKINPYTKYKKDIVLKLKKDYSFDLYHLAKKHQAMGCFEMSLEHIKNELGLPKSYDKLCNLKDRVLKPSLDEICTSTDIVLTYENIKKGRSVVGFKFKVKEKPTARIEEKQNRDVDTIDMFFNMSDAQINMYGNQLASLTELGSMANVGETTSNFATRIKMMLKDPQQQEKFHPYLKRLGFISKR